MLRSVLSLLRPAVGGCPQVSVRAAPSAQQQSLLRLLSPKTQLRARWNSNHAAVLSAPGDLRYIPHSLPESIAPDHVRVKLRAVGICGTDVHLLATVSGRPMITAAPSASADHRTLFAGSAEAIGCRAALPTQRWTSHSCWVTSLQGKQMLSSPAHQQACSGTPLAQLSQAEVAQGCGGCGLWCPQLGSRRQSGP